MGEKKQYDLVVVGSGPGGYVAAVRAVQLGFKVACVEKAARLGGVCLNVGCIPSKALLDSSEHFIQAKENFSNHGIRFDNLSFDLAVMMARKEKVVADLTDQVEKLLDRHKIDVFHGTARLESPREVAVTVDDGSPKILSAKNILLATGSETVSVPGISIDGDRIVDSTGALSFDAVPEHLVVVGGGYVGLELGSVWRRLGSAVTVVEMLPKIAATMDGRIIRSLERMLRKQGLDFRLETRVSGVTVTNGTVKVAVEGKDGASTLECDRVLVAVGRRPLTRGLNLEAAGVGTDSRTGHVRVNSRYQTDAETVYAIGDLVPGPALAHKASAEGIAAVENMAGKPGEVNYDAIPAVIYTWPEAAAVGITEETAKERRIPYCVGTYPFSGTGRARCMGETDGFVKLICHSKTDRILGVHILGPRAADMIAEGVLAMEFGAGSEDIARTVHGHPTFSEALMEAAQSARKCSIYTS
ncbi:MULTISPECIES: dihydrolipoyl dehydrogenase [Desulfococcus]|jgi:dihydrolipoamide dehydrogenase|uniref:Dihydrolipoyl dehydrogenase n=1 Tax=Desulfococcus multivorans DSM 2059 TaxID=1121405 RepID=S7U1U7_DESML|nr:dihydrolipoyl dehydrogenase [Desulfococcus multivorans]AOY58865.1 LpdA1: dihydrolipoyl dehydrogenase (E3 component of 2-oxoglutarate dehydrogenase complex) [Desulfococcus multivorans]AQV01150.1 dihydrolipoyl dehydrogenase [Desulfococcus multivorans]EPR42990.1 dihydrolipoamide dehydrogenase [Desulfococcus multivorans DSM 2059]MDX9818691.1 dihydrolipoyl dehydrogenase [Desulfococcus multivorans]SJZ52089.1 dihydrolipoamide dehydrogenase [Desulfococcus multivorans DSM 2059]